MKKIILFYSLPQRDKAIDELLANKLRRELESRGEAGEVRVAPFLPDNRAHILYYKPDIIVIPEARCEYTVDLAEQCMKWGVRVVAKRTEGGASWGAWEKMEEAERATVIGAWPYDVDLEIVWSERFKELLAKHGYLPEEKIFAAGAFPFDPYFEYPPAERTWTKPRVLFATGWGHADRQPEYNVPEAPPDSPIHKDAYERHSKGRAKWIEMMDKFISKFGDKYDYFLRLKTGEAPLAYQQALGGRVKIILPCYTYLAIDNCDVLIHAGSTMGIEAHLRNKPALSFCGSINQVPGYDYPNVSPDYDDVDELIEAFEKLDMSKSNADLDNLKVLEREFYGKIDGKACERAAKKILDLEVRPTCIPEQWPESKKTYDTPGVYKFVEGWVCEACKKQCFNTILGREMIKCPHCGISLAKKPGVQVLKK